MKKTKILILIFGIVALGILSGCKSQMITVDVIPADAKVIINGSAYNNGSPIFAEVCSGQQVAITAYKEGFREKIHVIDYSLSDIGTIEAWTCWLVLPTIGLFCDNAWELDENNIQLTLEPLTLEAKEEIKGKYHHADADITQDKKNKEAFEKL